MTISEKFKNEEFLNSGLVFSSKFCITGLKEHSNELGDVIDHLCLTKYLNDCVATGRDIMVYLVVKVGIFYKEFPYFEITAKWYDIVGRHLNVHTCICEQDLYNEFIEQVNMKKLNDTYTF